MAYEYSGNAPAGEAAGVPARYITDDDLHRLPPRAHRHILESPSYTHDGGDLAVYNPPDTQERFDVAEAPPPTADDDSEGDDSDA